MIDAMNDTETNFDITAYWQQRGKQAMFDLLLPKDQAELAHLACWVERLQPASILDVGSGWGRLLVFLRGRRYQGIYSLVDFVPSMREGCLKAVGVAPTAWDGVRLPYADQSFDLVLAARTILHVPPARVRQYLDEQIRVARRWIYVLTNNIATASPHCFNHDYTRLFEEAGLTVKTTTVFHRERACWILGVAHG